MRRGLKDWPRSKVPCEQTRFIDGQIPNSQRSFLFPAVSPYPPGFSLARGSLWLKASAATPPGPMSRWGVGCCEKRFPIISAFGKKDTPVKSCGAKCPVRKKSYANMMLQALFRSTTSCLIQRSYAEIWISPLALAVSVAELCVTMKRRRIIDLGVGQAHHSIPAALRSSTTPLFKGHTEYKCHIVTSSKGSTQLMRNSYVINKTKTKPDTYTMLWGCSFIVNQVPLLCQACHRDFNGLFSQLHMFSVVWREI